MKWYNYQQYVNMPDEQKNDQKVELLFLICKCLSSLDYAISANIICILKLSYIFGFLASIISHTIITHVY